MKSSAMNRSILVTAACLHASALAIGAAEQRFWLASQYDWEAKRGFYLRKYGPEAWEAQVTAQALRRVQAWGFCGGGGWGAPAGLVSTPVLHRGGVPILAGHPDAFDPAVCKVLRDVIAAQIAPRRQDPLILGWSLGNEMDEVIRSDEVRAILRLGADVAAKRAFVDQAITGRGPGHGDQLVYGEHYAFGVVSETVGPRHPHARS